MVGNEAAGRPDVFAVFKYTAFRDGIGEIDVVPAALIMVRIWYYDAYSLASPVAVHAYNWNGTDLFVIFAVRLS